MAEPNERLKTLVSTNDGFVVAQKDLELRGAGEFFGTRQHGEPQMPALMLTGDVRLLERTRAGFSANQPAGSIRGRSIARCWLRRGGSLRAAVHCWRETERMHVRSNLIETEVKPPSHSC